MTADIPSQSTAPTTPTVEELREAVANAIGHASFVSTQREVDTLRSLHAALPSLLSAREALEKIAALPTFDRDCGEYGGCRMEQVTYVGNGYAIIKTCGDYMRTDEIEEILKSARSPETRAL